jgi:hypothetical protein
MPINEVFSKGMRDSYNRAVTVLEDGTNYVVNNPKKALQTKKNNVRMAQSTLFSEVKLNTTINSYQFQIKDGKPNTGAAGAQYPNEIRLLDQDVFFAYRLGFYLRCTSAAGGAVKNILFTHPSGLIAGTGGSDINKMIGLWNGGVLSFKVGGEVVTPSYALRKTLVIQQTQAPVNAIAGTMPFDQVDMDNDGWAETAPNWIFNGGNDNQLIVTYPSDYADYGLGTAEWHLCLTFEGWLAQNASSIMDNMPKQ